MVGTIVSVLNTSSNVGVRPTTVWYDRGDMIPIQYRATELSRKHPETTHRPYAPITASIPIAIGFLGFLFVGSYPATTVPIVIAVIATVTVRRCWR